MMKYWKEYPEFASNEYFPSNGINTENEKISKGFDINEDELWIVFQHYQQSQHQMQDDRSDRSNLDIRNKEEIERERNYELMVKQKLRKAALDFLQKFGTDVRDIICNTSRNTEASKLTKKGIAPGMASLASLVMIKMGYPEPLAIGFATYIFMVISEASRTAFCSGYQKD